MFEFKVCIFVGKADTELIGGHEMRKKKGYDGVVKMQNRFEPAVCLIKELHINQWRINEEKVVLLKIEGCVEVNIMPNISIKNSNI